MVIHHVGLVVKNIHDHFKKHIHSALQFHELSQIIKDENLGVEVAFVNMNNRILLELVRPINDHSPVFNFLKKYGQTLHHICFEVTDIEKECERMRACGYMITAGPTPAAAFEGRKVAFLMAKEENYLIELLQV